MKLHRNAALSWQGRRRLATRVVEEGWTLTAAAASAGVSVRCAHKWVCRYREEGERGLWDRSSAPHRVANRTSPERVQAVMALRRLRFTAAEIAEALAMALSTVSAILRRVGMGRLGRLGLEQPVRYERARPGELVHVDVKKLGRIEGGAGWRVRGGAKHYNRTVTDRDGHRRNTVGYEYVHIAIDDFSRLASAEVLTDEKASTAVAFLRRAVAFYRRVFGMRIQFNQGTESDWSRKIIPIVGIGKGPQFLAFASSRTGARIDHFCLGMQDFRSAEVAKMLAAHGVTAAIRMRRDSDPPSEELTFRDPDGIVVQVQDVSYCGGEGVLGSRCT